MNGKQGENAYTIIETLHKSRQYCVYKARNYYSGRVVTIKTTEQGFQSDQEQSRRLRDEAQTGLKLKHESIRQTLGLFEESGKVYMISEFLEGDSLNDILRIPHVDINYSQALNWTLRMLEAVEHAHKLQILHLNLNPSNLIITTDFKLKAFGFGKYPHLWKTAEVEKHTFHPVIFTPPEIFREENPTERSDLYSVGVISWLLLRGRLPWELDRKESPSAQKRQSFMQSPLDPKLPGKHIPTWLFSILNKAMMPDPDWRFASATQMREAILAQKEFPMPGPDTDFSRISPSDEEAGKKHETHRGSDTDNGKAVSPDKKPDPDTVPRPRGKNRIMIEEDQTDLKRMVRIFRIIAIISFLIVAYIVVKYFVIKEKPAFSDIGESKQTSQLEEIQTIA